MLDFATVCLSKLLSHKKKRIIDKIIFGFYRTNEIVLGHFEGSYYRARVLDAAKSGIIVLFIDYGNMALLRTDEVFPISGEIDVAKFSFEICSLQFIVDSKKKSCVVCKVC